MQNYTFICKLITEFYENKHFLKFEMYFGDKIIFAHESIGIYMNLSLIISENDTPIIFLKSGDNILCEFDYIDFIENISVIEGIVYYDIITCTKTTLISDDNKIVIDSPETGYAVFIIDIYR